MMAENPYDLPHLKEIFKDLCKGKHICSEDGKHYTALKTKYDNYYQMFEGLGFKLVNHHRDFFYFHGEKPSDNINQIALFMYILMDYIDTQGEPIIESILTKEFTIADMPHFSTDRNREYMKEIGIGGLDELKTIVKALKRYGFADTKDNITFRFRTPACRFFDICEEVLQREV